MFFGESLQHIWPAAFETMNSSPIFKINPALMPWGHIQSLDEPTGAVEFWLKLSADDL